LVLDNQSLETHQVPEWNRIGTDQSIHNVGTRFSAKYVENLFNGLPFTRHDNPKLNSLYQPQYDWIETGSNAIFRRFWVVNCKSIQ
jgi:hypothetical protein